VARLELLTDRDEASERLLLLGIVPGPSSVQPIEEARGDERTLLKPAHRLGGGGSEESGHQDRTHRGRFSRAPAVENGFSSGCRRWLQGRANKSKPHHSTQSERQPYRGEPPAPQDPDRSSTPSFAQPRLSSVGLRGERDQLQDGSRSLQSRTKIQTTQP